MPLADWRARLAGLVGDGDLARLLPAGPERALPLAVSAPGADTGAARIALPAGWEAGAYAARGVEYPVGRTPRAALPASAWRIDGGALLLQATAAGAPRRPGLPAEGDSAALLYAAIGGAVKRGRPVGLEELRDAALADAAARYSTDRPRRVHADLAAPAPDSTGAARAGWPADWRPGASAALWVEYPVGRAPAAALPRARWRALPEGLALRGLAAGAKARLHYALPHALDAARDTIPAADSEAVLAWAAARLCDRLAAATAGDTDAAIGADAVDRSGPSARWRRLAEDGRARYRSLLGLSGRPAPAFAAAAPRRARRGARTA